MADKANDKPETVTLLGKECSVIRRTDGTDKITMRKADFDDVLTSHGVGAEVRDAVRKADDEIMKEVLAFQSKRLLELNKGKKEGAEGFVPRSIITLGAGSGALETEIKTVVRHTSKNIKTGEPLTTVKCGQVRVTKEYKFGSELRKEGGLLDQIEEQFTKIYGPKK